MTQPIFSRFRATALGATALCALALPAQADQVILDDLIVSGSACIGFDCVNGENFGFDTLRLKENNLRIKAQDTSTTGSFPSNDWQITFNDASNGGQNKFSIDDIDGDRTPFTIEAGAPSHSLYVEDGGRIGLGTSTPVVQLHQKDGNTPALRLEQDGSSGFSPQTWDIAGNEANFFIRDVSNGSTLPFRIEPGAPSNAVYIDSTGNIGLSNTNPTAPLHITRADGTAKLFVQELSSSISNRDMLVLENKGRPRIILSNIRTDNSALAGEWSISAGDTFVIQDRSNGDNELVLTGDGNMTIRGALTQNSDKTRKMAIVPVDQGDILSKVLDLPLSYWTYKTDAEKGIRHIGPMAQDFYAAFGTGQGPKGISTLDTSGVALAAIQALAHENAQLEARLQALETLLSEKN